MDAIPVASQLKSLVQVICGQAEEARQTQINFSKQCPVVSQIRSAVESAKGDNEAARETQVVFGKFLLVVVNGLPVIGHVKGITHYALGDKDSGDLAMKSASHTSAVIGGGIAGMVVGGPVGSVAMGIGAGAAMDGTITAVDSAVKKEFSPFGVLEVAKDPTNAGKWCDAVGGVALDGVLGRAAGGLVRAPKPAAAGAAAADETVVAVRSGFNAAQFAKLSTVKSVVAVIVKIYKNAANFYNKNGELIATIKKECNVFRKKYQQKPTLDDHNNLAEELSVPVTSTEELCVKTIQGVKYVYLNEKLICIFIDENMYDIVDGQLHKLDHELRYVMKNNGDLEEVEDTCQVDSELVSQEVDIDAQSCGSSVYYETTEDMNIDLGIDDSLSEEMEIVDLKEKTKELNIK